MKQNSAVFLIIGLKGGGSEKICVNLATALSQRGWKITLVVMSLKEAVYLERLSDEVNIVDLKRNHVRFSIFSLLKFLIKNKPAQVLVFDYAFTALTLMLRSIFKLKIRVISRNNSVLSMVRKSADNLWKRLVVVPLIDKFYFRADNIINQCSYMQEDFIKLYPSTKDKCVVVNNPVDSEIEKIAKTTRKADKEKYILCVGRLEKVKSFHYAIEAFSLARSCLKGNYHLKIVGQGSLEKELKNLTRRLNIEQHVVFEGFHKNIAPYYLKAQATLLTSAYEGFPNVLIESITLGTPIISFNCPCGPREIINHLNGKLVKANDVAALSSAIIDVCNSDYDIESVRSTSYRYKMDKIIKQYELILNSS